MMALKEDTMSSSSQVTHKRIKLIWQLKFSQLDKLCQHTLDSNNRGSIRPSCYQLRFIASSHMVNAWVSGKTRHICNLQVNEASLVHAQMWSGVCYVKPWWIKQVVSCPLKELRMPPALRCAQRPQWLLRKGLRWDMTVAPKPAMLPLQLARKSRER